MQTLKGGINTIKDPVIPSTGTRSSYQGISVLITWIKEFEVIGESHMHLLHDIVMLIDSLLDYAYWRLRTLGFSERDILDGTFTAAGLGLLTLCVVQSEPRSSWYSSAFFLPRLESFLLGTFRQNWVRQMKLGIQFTVVGWALLLLYQVPFLRSQETVGGPPTIYQIAKEHEDRLDQYERVQVIQGEQIKALIKFNENLGWWFVSLGMCAIVTIVGLTLTDMYKTLKAGHKERIREAHRVARERSEDEEDSRYSTD